MHNPKEIYRFFRRYYRDYRKSLPYNIKLFNYQWNSSDVQNHWLFQFIRKRGILKSDAKKTISIFSVNGERLAIKLNHSNYKVFYTVENVHVPQSNWQMYEDLFLNDDNIDLSIGFDYIDHEKYIRFPYWMMTNFEPEADFESIKQTCNILNKPNIDLSLKSRFCSFVCRNDYVGTRKIIFDQLSQVDRIDCDGKFMNNNNDLKLKYNDNKREYLKRYRFNLCPENSDSEGYITEKIFDSIISGCIPIYWGSENNPEPEILNQNAIFFISQNSENKSLIQELTAVNNNPKLYLEFASQNRLQKNSQDIIYEYFMKLDRKLREIVNEI